MPESPRRLLVTGDGRTVADRVEVARSTWTRFKGLMLRRDQPPALWIEPCNSIHMFLVRFPLDVAFLDRDGAVLRLYEGIRPWRVTRIVRRARTAVELPAGTLARVGVVAGDVLHLEPS
jgi:uncharacterized protein